MFYRLQNIIIIFLIGLLFLTPGCNKKDQAEKVIVARVGNQVITADDFLANYEFGLPHLKEDPNRKLSYLNYMIKEKLLALEGYRLGFDKSERVKKLENELLDELLVEEYFTKNVNDKIHVNDDEIHDAITKAKVSWKLRYWVEPNYEYANSVSLAMKKRGYSAVVDDILKSNPEINFKPKNYETGYLTWLDVTDELLGAVKDLPVGQISEPVEMNGVYFIFQVVDIRREPITEYDYNQNKERYRKILYYRKLNKKAAAFVSGFMTPRNVVTKGDAFRKLADAYFEWQGQKDKQDNLIQEIKSATEKQPACYQLKNQLDQVLVTFEGDQWTINDFINRFNPGKIKKQDWEDKESFRKALNQQIALSVRDHFMVREAKKMGLQKSPTVQSELKKWRDKWVYGETRMHFLDDLKIDKEQAKKYFDKYKDKYKIKFNDEPTFKEFENQATRDAYFQQAHVILDKQILALKNVYPVVINYNVLDSLKTIEFEKSRWASLQVYKLSSKRLAEPIVDPEWGL